MDRRRKAVVVGVANPEVLDGVFETAIAYARALGAELHVAHSVEWVPELPGIVPAAGWSAEVLARDDKRRARFSAAIDRAMRSRAFDRGSLRTHVSAAAPHELILRLAEEVDATLIVVGPGRHAGPSRHLIGSTAERVLAGASVPVLVVRNGCSVRPELMLWATDLSTCSAEALRRGLELTRYISPTRLPTIRQTLVLATEAPPLHREAMMAAARQAMLEMNEVLHEDLSVEARIRQGHPAKEIVAEAAECEADLIVMGSRGVDLDAGGIGSVAGATVRVALGDVLVVPAGPAPAHRGPGEFPDTDRSEPADTGTLESRV